jgi:hypothetical protein
VDFVGKDGIYSRLSRSQGLLEIGLAEDVRFHSGNIYGEALG